jgi:hypothetical protein
VQGSRNQEIGNRIKVSGNGTDAATRIKKQDKRNKERRYRKMG